MSLQNLLNDLNTGISNDFSSVKQRKAIAVRRIIKSLYYNSDQSNFELGQTLAMTPPSVNTLLNGLIKDGIVQMKGQGSSSGGRKPSVYGLVPDMAYIIGVDTDQYYTSMAIFNLHNKMVTPISKVPLRLNNETQTLETLIGEIRSLIESSKLDRKKILGLGLSIPGFVNTKTGVNHSFLDPGNQKPLRGYLENELGIKVYMENDASALALGESRFGEARGSNNVLVIKAGWGVGLGMILNGQLYRGHAGLAGEFSHIPIADNEILCQCGKQGCLETEISAMVLAKLAKEGIKNGQLSSLKKMADEDTEKIEADMVINAANNGDQYSVQILSTLGYKLGKGIAILIHLFNPELIVLSGRLAKANKFLTVPIQQALNKYCIPRLHDNTRIVVSNLGEMGGLLGAVDIVFENIFSDTGQ